LNEKKNNNDPAVQSSLTSVVKGSGTILAGLVIGKVLGTVNQVLFARILGPEEYGLLNLGLSITTILVMVALFGLQDGITRFVSMSVVEKNHRKLISTISFGIRFSLASSSLIALSLCLEEGRYGGQKDETEREEYEIKELGDAHRGEIVAYLLGAGECAENELGRLCHGEEDEAAQGERPGVGKYFPGYREFPPLTAEREDHLPDSNDQCEEGCTDRGDDPRGQGAGEPEAYQEEDDKDHGPRYPRSHFLYENRIAGFFHPPQYRYEDVHENGEWNCQGEELQNR